MSFAGRALRAPYSVVLTRIALGLLLALSITAATSAAELRLRARCQSRGAVVTLGDVAEIIATDQRQVDALAAIELFPAPPTGQTRFLRVREVQDLLLVRGVNLTEHRFSGSGQVTIGGGNDTVAAVTQPALPSSAPGRAKQQVRDAVIRYLQQRTSTKFAGRVDFELSDAQTRLFSDARHVSVSGGEAPLSGAQRFQVTVQLPDGPVQFPLEANVSVPPPAIITVRSLPRGTVVRETDVQIRRPEGQENAPGQLPSLQEVVGKETTRAVSAGQPLEPEILRDQVLVHRGEVVTVRANAAGIRVRATARARDDGALGEVITVESLSNRKTYFVRITGPQEAEVDPRSPAAVADPSYSASRVGTIRR